MKIFQNKNLLKKIIILFVLIVIISFCIPKEVNAGAEELGGALLKPIVNLFLGISDGVVNLIHKIVLEQDDTLFIVDLTGNNGGSILCTILVAIVVAVVVAAVVIVASEAVITALAAIGISNIAAVGVGTILAISVGSGTIAGVIVQSKYFDGDVRLPIYRISPEEIFSNKIPVFDVDFFNPMDDITDTKEISPENIEMVEVELKYEKTEEEGKEYAKFNFANHDFEVDISNANHGQTAYEAAMLDSETEIIGKAVLEYFKLNGKNTGSIHSNGGVFLEYELKDNGIIYKIKVISSSQNNLNTRYVYYSSELIETETIVLTSTAKELKGVISKWYSVLRNIALVALLLVLVYIGIRIITSSTASDKSKYKQMILDWVVAICLLFIMQYIMYFSNMLVKKVTELMCSVEFPEYQALIDDPNGKIEEAILYSDNEQLLKKYGIIPEDGLVTNIQGINHINWNTNLMGVIRIQAQLSKNKNMENTSLKYVGYMIMFVMLVLFTVYFVYTYLRRVLYMAFLTIMAPFVAMTYPIDKINDGKAQAFNMWLKEYIFNLLIQPLHLLLYTVLIGSAVEFAQLNILYSIVAIAFLIPAEKLTRKFFGFEKAQTPGLLSGAAGAALAWSGVNRLLGHKPPKLGGHNTKNGSKLNAGKDKNGINFANNFNKEDAILGYSSIGNNHKNSEKTPKVGQAKGAITNPNNKSKDERIFKDSKNDIIPKNDFYSKYGNDKTSKGRIKGIANKYATQGRYYAKNMKNKIRNSIQNAHPGRTIAKLGAGALGAATFATAGGIVGLTSGDPSKVLQYTTAGAIGGYNMLKDVPENIDSALSVDYTKEQNELIERSKYDSEEEYQEKQKEEYVKQLKQNADTLAKFERKLGREETKKLMESDFIDSYVDDGITDIDDMYAGYIMENGLDDLEMLERDYVKANIKYGKQIGSDTTHMKKDDKDKWITTFETQLSKNKLAIANKIDTHKSASEIIDNIDRFNNIKNNA